MSTWKTSHIVKFVEDTGDAYVDSEVSWEYQDTADILSVKTKIGEYQGWGKKHPEKETIERHSPTYGRALLETLIDWVETYEYEGYTAELIEKIKKAKNV